MPDDFATRLDVLINSQTALTAQSIGLIAYAMAADDDVDEAGLPATLDG